VTKIHFADAMQHDGQRVIHHPRVRGPLRAVRAVRNTRVFLTETRVDADVHQGLCGKRDRCVKKAS